MSQPHFGISVKMKLTPPKSEKLEFSGNGKVLKCRCPKWPRMCHLDICSPSYGQKKGQESNWQFDSRPLKVGNRPLLELWFRPHSNRRSEPGDMSSQSPGTPTRDSFGTPLWESWEKKPYECSLHREIQRILYGGRWWLPSSPGCGESSESKCPWLVSTPKGVSECELTLLWLVLDADLSEIILVPLPSLIPGLLPHPSTPC
jgi:hypothetical protein